MLFHIAVGHRPSPVRKIAYRSDQCKGARGDDAAPLEARLLAGVAEARHKHAVAHHVVGDVKRGDGVWRAVIPPGCPQVAAGRGQPGARCSDRKVIQVAAMKQSAGGLLSRQPAHHN